MIELDLIFVLFFVCESTQKLQHKWFSANIKCIWHQKSHSFFFVVVLLSFWFDFFCLCSSNTGVCLGQHTEKYASNVNIFLDFDEIRHELTIVKFYERDKKNIFRLVFCFHVLVVSEVVFISMANMNPVKSMCVRIDSWNIKRQSARTTEKKNVSEAKEEQEIERNEDQKRRFYFVSITMWQNCRNENENLISFHSKRTMWLSRDTQAHPLKVTPDCFVSTTLNAFDFVWSSFVCWK